MFAILDALVFLMKSQATPLQTDTLPLPSSTLGLCCISAIVTHAAALNQCRPAGAWGWEMMQPQEQLHAEANAQIGLWRNFKDQLVLHSSRLTSHQNITIRFSDDFIWQGISNFLGDAASLLLLLLQASLYTT